MLKLASLEPAVDVGKNPQTYDGVVSASPGELDDLLVVRRTDSPTATRLQRLKPLDRQVMLLYLEEEDAASIAEITGLSVANVSTKVSRIKQILVRQFHQGGRDGT